MTTKTSSNSDTLLELAERCEAATGPDARLNAEIVAALNNALLKPYPPQTDFGPGQRWQFWSLDGKHFLGNEAKHPFKVLPFTASVDAALTLVPEGWDGALYLATDTHKPEVQLETPAMRSALSMDDERVEGAAATLPLALCAAALRAKARGE